MLCCLLIAAGCISNDTFGEPLDCFSWLTLKDQPIRPTETSGISDWLLSGVDWSGFKGMVFKQVPITQDFSPCFFLSVKWEVALAFRKLSILRCLPFLPHLSKSALDSRVDLFPRWKRCRKDQSPELNHWHLCIVFLVSSASLLSRSFLEILNTQPAHYTVCKERLKNKIHKHLRWEEYWNMTHSNDFSHFLVIHFCLINQSLKERF